MGIRYEKDGAVATFTIENGKVNAFTPEMHKELYDAVSDFCADRSLHVGILTGAGDKAFCAGDDIKNPHGHQDQGKAMSAHFFPSTEEEAHLRPGWERELRTMERYKPIIGAINGPAVGMGVIYMLNLTDIRVATPGAFIGLLGQRDAAVEAAAALAHHVLLLLVVLTLVAFGLDNQHAAVDVDADVLLLVVRQVRFHYQPLVVLGVDVGGRQLRAPEGAQEPLPEDVLAKCLESRERVDANQVSSHFPLLTLSRRSAR